MDTLAITHTLIADCLVLPKSFMTGLFKNWKKKGTTYVKIWHLETETKICLGKHVLLG